MASSESQRRCVFVGNIPYDATEEQLVQICEEVGPVVSFRLVIDRETGKPKGYGFCEYKDEETALSARRNLQGYEINGRQLRVDFAENDKNADRNREQGRGGPGMATHTDSQKQIGGPIVLGDSSLHQPIGVSVAMAAAAVMAGALGAPQMGSTSNQSSLQGQPMLGSDPLTLHLAKMSRSQLTQIIADMKAVATQNKEQAHQLLSSMPALPKALLQVEIMLGMVTPQMLQVPNIRQASPLPILQDGQQGPQLASQILSGLPPLPQIKVQHPALPQFPTQSQMQLPPLSQIQGLHHGLLPQQSGAQTLPSIPQQGNLSVPPQLQVLAPASLKQQMQPPLLQQPGQIVSSLLPRPHAFPSALSGTPDDKNKDPRGPQLTYDSAQSTKPTMPSRVQGKARVVTESLDQINHPSKLQRLNEGRKSISDVNVATPVSGSSGPSVGISGHQTLKGAEGVSHSGKQVTQVQLPPEVESALLQQVLNLTPEQLSSLPPDQQQQVIQLQQMLRQPT